MIRDAGFLRRPPGKDDLYLTIDGNRAVIRKDDVPKILTRPNEPAKSPVMIPIFYNRIRVGTARCQPRPKHPDLILVDLYGLEYRIYKDQFIKVWIRQMKWAKVHEKIPVLWQGFNRQEATA
jgi:hypothetical protein